jgi:hypothetical protein
VRRLTPALCPQTVDLTARLPAAESTNLKSATIRVLVVDPEGLVTIYSPVSPIQSAAPAVTLGSDVSSKVISKVMAGHRKKINTEVTPTTTKSPSAVSTHSIAAPYLSVLTCCPVLLYGKNVSYFVRLMHTYRLLVVGCSLRPTMPLRFILILYYYVNHVLHVLSILQNIPYNCKVYHNIATLAYYVNVPGGFCCSEISRDVRYLLTLSLLMSYIYIYISRTAPLTSRLIFYI